jgi:hypothetical protein
MLDTFIGILNGAPPERRLIDNFADVLENKIIGVQVSVRPQTISFFLGFNDRNIGVLFALEALILTTFTTVAITISAAFHFRRTVDTVRIFPTRLILAIPWA